MSLRTLCPGKAKGPPRSAPGGPFTAKWIVRATVVLSYRSSCKACRSFAAPHDAPCGRCAAPRDASFDRCDAPHAASRDLCAVGGAVPYRTFPERTESMVPERWCWSSRLHLSLSFWRQHGGRHRKTQRGGQTEKGKGASTRDHFFTHV